MSMRSFLKPAQIAEQFTEALDQDNFQGLRKLLGEECTYQIGTQIELAELTGKHIAGGAIDISKFFDQMPRQLIYMLVRCAGMPTPIVESYRRYQEALEMRNTVAGGVGKPYQKNVGIPQGGGP